MDKPNEKWARITDFPRYSVSNLGRVRRDVPGPGTQAGRILNPPIDGPYRRVALRHNGRTRFKRVHSLVAEHFIGPRPEGAHVNHVDGDKLNNAWWNLEYVTPKENTLHQHKIGLARVRGEQNGHAKLNEASVREIRRLRGKVEGQELARRYGVSPTTISQVQKRLVWRHVK